MGGEGRGFEFFASFRRLKFIYFFTFGQPLVLQPGFLTVGGVMESSELFGVPLSGSGERLRLSLRQSRPGLWLVWLDI